MSLSTKEAIFSRLESDASLNAMLARDSHPNANGRPAIYSAWRANAPKDDSPMLLVRWVDPDMETDRSPDQSKGLSGVWRETVHFQAWARTTDDVPTRILDRVQDLFHYARFPLSDGIVLCMRKIGGQPELFDDRLEESFGVAIYELEIAR